MSKRKKKAPATPKRRKPRNATFDDFKTFLHSHLASLHNDGGEGEVPHFPDFDLLPQDYLSYANEAIGNPTDANRINSVGHLKRAAECQADTFFHVLSLSKRPQTKNFPRKMESIARLDLIPSRSLTKLNQIRNKVEHEYAVPEIDDLELYFDLVAGFVAALDGAIFMMAAVSKLESSSHSDDEPEYVGFSIEYNTEKPCIESGMHDGDTTSIFTPTPDDWEPFIGALRAFFLLARYAFVVSSDYVLQHLESENTT